MLMQRRQLTKTINVSTYKNHTNARIQTSIRIGTDLIYCYIKSFTSAY